MSDLREKYAAALHQAQWDIRDGGLDGGSLNDARYLADAVLAVRDAEVERLRGQVEQARATGKHYFEIAFGLAAERDSAEARLAAVEALIADGPEKWRGYDTHDIGHAFLADTVLDWVDDLRRALASVPAVDAGDREPASEGGA